MNQVTYMNSKNVKQSQNAITSVETLAKFEALILCMPWSIPKPPYFTNQVEHEPYITMSHIADMLQEPSKHWPNTKTIKPYATQTCCTITYKSIMHYNDATHQS